MSALSGADLSESGDLSRRFGDYLQVWKEKEAEKQRYSMCIYCRMYSNGACPGIFLYNLMTKHKPFQDHLAAQQMLFRFLTDDIFYTVSSKVRKNWIFLKATVKVGEKIKK